MGGSIFGSSADQKSKTLNLQRNINVSGQGVVNQPTTKNSGNLTYRLNGRGTLNVDQRTFTTVEGVSEDRLAEVLERLNDRARENGTGQAPTIPSTGGTDPPGTSDPDSVAARIDDQVTEGSPSEMSKTGWLMAGAVGVGLLALVAVVFILKRFSRKKGSA